MKFKSHQQMPNWSDLALLTALFMLPAFANFAPILMEDSIAYSGGMFDWMRSKIPPLLVGWLYQLIGLWALPLVNSLLNASAWLILRQWLAIKVNIWFIVIIAIATLSPLYTSAVLVDAWFFPAAVFLIYGIDKGYRPLIAFAALLFAAHGSSLILVPVLLVLYCVLWRRWPGFWNTVIVFIVLLGSNAALDRALPPDPPRFSKIFVASKAFSADPTLLNRRAAETGDPSVAYAADYMQTDAALKELAKGRKDIFWDIWNSDHKRFDIIAFEANHAAPIIISALSEQPLLFLKSGLQDFASYYSISATLDFRAVHETPWPDVLKRSWQGHGVFDSALTSHITGILALGTLLTALGLVFLSRRHTSADQRAFIILAGATILANDLVFAFLSGPPDRYHHRALPFAGVAIIIAIAALRQSKHRYAAVNAPD